MKKQRVPYLRWLNYAAMILAVIAIVKALYQTFRYSKVYQDSPEEIAAQLDSGDHWGMSIETMKDEINARVHILNGCSQIGTLDLQSGATLSISGKRRFGEAKLMLLDGANQVAYLGVITSEADTVAVSPGSYQVVVVGYWYSGSTSLEIREQVSSPLEATSYAPLATGGYNMLALKEDGSLLAWGDNMYGTVATDGFINGGTARSFKLERQFREGMA